MCDASVNKKPPLELADIFSAEGERYQAVHGISREQRKAMRAIVNCRTSVLGGHVYQCHHCGQQEISYNSCRYRACPKCQTMKQLTWLENRQEELLPVHYYHVVFTIPHELNVLASYNPSLIYNLLFRSAWSTINNLGHDPARLNGQMGMLALLHTWGQTLSQHIHTHCLIPGGAIVDGEQGKTWHASSGKYLFPTRVMSALFGPMFIDGLKKAYENGELVFGGACKVYKDAKKFFTFTRLLYKKSWNVYAKAPFNGAQGGLAYLARYVSKIAISNHRLVSFEDGKVTFKWRDYADGNKEKLMTLDAHEFIRRYLSHVLPSGFMRIRYFGFLASACKEKNIALIRSLVRPVLPMDEAPLPQKTVDNSLDEAQAINVSDQSTQALIHRLTGIDVSLCKHCQIGRLEKVQTLLSKKAYAAQYLNSS